MRLFVVLLSASLAFGATRKEPPECSSRPCTYTITCAARTCTAAEVREVQAALDDAHRGDTIKLQADRIFPSSRSLVIRRRPGSDGYLTITTTDDARLPDPNTRITPAYASLLPTLAVSGRNSFALGLAGDDRPAEYVLLKGLRFTASVDTVVALLMIGNDGNEYDWRYPDKPISEANQPDNIIVDRCLFDQDFNVWIRRLVAVHARATTIKNSYLDGARELNSDTQSISAVQGPGPLTVENCYIGGATENVIFGGDGGIFDEASHSGLFRFNYFPKVEERMRYRPWSAGMVVFKGRIIRPSRQTGITYQAQNSGVTGNVEPFWPADAGATVDDNGITWRRIATGNARTVAKNNFEIKSARNMTIQYNVFERTWFDTNQYNNIVFKLENCVEKSSTCNCVPEYKGRVNANGRVVRSADGKPLPNLHHPRTRYNVDPFLIKIDSKDYEIESFDPVNDYQITLKSDAGVLTDVQYTYGHPRCRASWDWNIRFENNIVRSGPMGLSITNWDNGVRGRVGRITVANNLFVDLDCRKWGNDFNGCSAIGDRTPYLFFGQLPPEVSIVHNTVLGARNFYGIFFADADQTYSGDTVLTDNILSSGSRGGVTGDGYLGTDGSRPLNGKLCGGKPCPTRQFDRNIIAGVNLGSYNTGTTYNLCPDSRRCEADFGALFEDYRGGVYRVRQGHFAKGGGTDGVDIGADFDRLPRIYNLRAEATDRMAVLTYEVSKPIEDIPCVLEVSTERDLSSMIPDLDPVRFLRPDSDHRADSGTRGARRMIRVGKNVPLSPEQTYWYRLQCGGDAASGSFTTRSAQTGPRTFTLPHTPQIPGVASTVVEFGYSYDRFSDSILNWTATSPVSCSRDVGCQVPVTVEEGEILYYRIIDRDQNGVEIARSPVMVTADPVAAAFPQPKFTLEAVLNSASGESGAVAPCQIVAIYGSGLGPEQLSVPADGPVAERLENVRLLFDRKAAPLLYARTDQLSGVTPARIADQPLTEVQIEYGSQRSDPVMVPVATARPGIFTADRSGRGQGAIVNQDGNFNGPGSPAPRGSVVLVFGTSGGPMSPPCQEGKVVEGPQYLQLPVSATVGGVAARVEYAGSAPGLIMGLLQINLRIPDDAPSGDAVPLSISVGGAATQEGVTLAIR